MRWRGEERGGRREEGRWRMEEGGGRREEGGTREEGGERREGGGLRRKHKWEAVTRAARVACREVASGNWGRRLRWKFKVSKVKFEYAPGWPVRCISNFIMFCWRPL